VDVNSGAVHVVDDISFDILDYYKNFTAGEIKNKLAHKYNADEIDEALREIESLEAEGLLFSEDPYKEYVSSMDRKSVVKALCLHISHDCNLRCKYCFGKKAIDFLISEDFFGGEPMMNFDVVKGIIEYARQKEKEHNKNFRFTLTTNGLLLNDENIKYINEN